MCNYFSAQRGVKEREGEGGDERTIGILQFASASEAAESGLLEQPELSLHIQNTLALCFVHFPTAHIFALVHKGY